MLLRVLIVIFFIDISIAFWYHHKSIGNSTSRYKWHLVLKFLKMQFALKMIDHIVSISIEASVRF